jgi:hypothetical protein
MQAKVIKELKVEKRSYLLPPQMNKWIKPGISGIGISASATSLRFWSKYYFSQNDAQTRIRCIYRFDFNTRSSYCII